VTAELSAGEAIQYKTTGLTEESGKAAIGRHKTWFCGAASGCIHLQQPAFLVAYGVDRVLRLK